VLYQDTKGLAQILVTLRHLRYFLCLLRDYLSVLINVAVLGMDVLDLFAGQSCDFLDVVDALLEVSDSFLVLELFSVQVFLKSTL